MLQNQNNLIYYIKWWKTTVKIKKPGLIDYKIGNHFKPIKKKINLKKKAKFWLKSKYYKTFLDLKLFFTNSNSKLIAWY